MARFKVGQSFQSSKDLFEFKNLFESENFCQLCISASRTIAGGRKRGIVRKIREELKYYSINLTCIHSGYPRNKSKGVRQTRTYRQGCPFCIHLRVSEDGNRLEVLKVVDEHNHIYSPDIYSLLPRQRRLEGIDRKVVKRLLDLNTDKKLLREAIFETTNKVVTPRDLHNLIHSFKNESQVDKTSINGPAFVESPCRKVPFKDPIYIANSLKNDALQNVLLYLQKKSSGIVEMVVSEESILLGLFYQDEEMINTFSHYPEILFICAVHSVSNLKLPLYILAVENGNGETEIVGFFIATAEEQAMLLMMKIFKRHNPQWTKTQVVMADKDFVGRNFITEEFTQASLITCAIHTLHCFSRDLATEKLGVTKSERILCLDIFKKMANSKNEKQYKKQLENLQNTNLKSVIQYFQENWNNCREQWVHYLQKTTFLKSRTSNKLHLIISKVKQIIKEHPRLVDLFKNLDILVSKLRKERNLNAALPQVQMQVNRFEDEAQRMYFQYLTPYAFELVSSRFHMKDREVVIESNFLDEMVTVKSGDQILEVSSQSCSCDFFTNYCLPCHHILKVRELKYLNLFCESLVAERWTITYYNSSCKLSSHLTSKPMTSHDETGTHQQVQTHHEVEADHQLETHPHESSSNLCELEKSQLIYSKVLKMTALAAGVNSHRLKARLKVLDKIIEFWENNTEVSVYPLDHINDVENPLAAADHPLTTKIMNYYSSIAEANNSATNSMDSVVAATEHPENAWNKDYYSSLAQTEYVDLSATDYFQQTTDSFLVTEHPLNAKVMDYYSSTAQTEEVSSSSEDSMDSFPELVKDNQASNKGGTKSKISNKQRKAASRFRSTIPWKAKHSNSNLKLDRAVESLEILHQLRNLVPKQSAAQKILDYQDKQSRKRRREAESIRFPDETKGKKKRRKK